MSIKPQSHVWVIEMFSKINNAWEPCAEAQISRSEARRVMNFYWRHNHPEEKFRVAKYVRA